MHSSLIYTLSETPSKFIPVSSVFSAITGTSEQVFFDDANEREREQALMGLAGRTDQGKLTLRNAKTNTTVPAGSWKSVSLDDLRRDTAKMQSDAGSFSLIVSRRPSTHADMHKLVSQESLQADLANKGAVFQIFTTTHGLPSIGIGDFMISMNTWYQTSGQDNAAALSTPSGFIARWLLWNYGKRGERPTQWPQTPTSQYNMYSRTQLPVINGFVDFNLRSPQDIAFSEDAIEVLVHESVPVLYGERKGKMLAQLAEPSHINQILVSAIDFGVTHGVENNSFLQDPRTRNTTLSIAQALMNATYEATLRAAYQILTNSSVETSESRILYLTPVGIGSYANSFTHVVNALTRLKDLIIASGLDVRLVVYNVDTTATTADSTNTQSSPWILWKELATLAQTTKGSITIADTKQGVIIARDSDIAPTLQAFIEAS